MKWLDSFTLMYYIAILWADIYNKGIEKSLPEELKEKLT